MSSERTAPVDTRINELLRQMTLEEKAAMTAGSDPWHSSAIERLGIPPLKLTDGPNGARGDGRSGATAACFPVGVALAATWNPDLVREVGSALGEETKSKGAQILLAPTVNIHRSPLAGRNFECYSEDPFLSARIAVAFIQGVQSRGVGACVKHFVCNDSEFERHTISSDVGERTLREIYLVPFEVTVAEADPWVVMAAYNRINGVYACGNRRLLTEILRDEWGFQGIVISDWGATQDTVETANAGLDLEMPGPSRHLGARLLEALQSGAVDEEVVDNAVRRLLHTLIRSGKLDDPDERTERSDDRPEHRALARRAAVESMVLLKNERGLLPLDRSRLRTLAVIGPNAEVGQIMGGGSSQVAPHYVSHPLQALRERCGASVTVVHETGCLIHKFTPEIDPARFVAADQTDPRRPISVQYFDSPDCSGAVVHERQVRQIGVRFFGVIPGVTNSERFSCRWRATFAPERSGVHTFGLTAAGLARLFVDGREIIDNWTNPQPGEWLFGRGSRELMGEVEMEAGKTYEITVEYSRNAELLAGLRLGMVPPVPQQPMERAVTAAKEADAVVLIVGTTSEWETEGNDRADMELPGQQRELIEKVAAANPNTVVVVNAGSPIAMDWLDRVPAVLQVWFPGQEFGSALADVLFGDVSPSGKLPTTFPKRLEDNPAFFNYPGENGHVLYGEGIFVGYRGYDARDIEPLFPFGHGLSYTTFEYGEASVTVEGPDTVSVEVEITNTGARAGQEIVQCYVRDVEASLSRPPQELKGFAKVALEPSERKTARIVLDRRAFSFHDPARAAWVLEPGEFEVRIGASSRDIRAVARVTLPAVPDGGA